MINAREQAAFYLGQARKELARHADKSNAFAQYQDKLSPGCHLRNARHDIALARKWTAVARQQADELARAKQQLVRAGERVVESWEAEKAARARVEMTQTCGYPDDAHREAVAALKDESDLFTRRLDRAVKRAAVIRSHRYASARAAFAIAQAMQGAF